MIYDIPNYVGLENIHSKVNIIMKPTNSPTQGQPNPRKTGSKVEFGSHFFSPQQIIFRGLGLISYRNHTTRKPNPTKFSPKHPNNASIPLHHPSTRRVVKSSQNEAENANN